MLGRSNAENAPQLRFLGLGVGAFVIDMDIPLWEGDADAFFVEGLFDGFDEVQFGLPPVGWFDPNAAQDIDR